MGRRLDKLRVLYNTHRTLDSVSGQHGQPRALQAQAVRAKQNFGLPSELTYFLLMTVVTDFPTNFQRTLTSRLRLTSLARRSHETLLFGLGGRRLADGRDDFCFLCRRKLAHPDFGDPPLLINQH